MEKWRTKTIEIDDDYKYETIRIIFLKSKEDILMSLKHGLGTGHFYDEDLAQYILFPLAPLDIQKQILNDIEKIEQQEKGIEREIATNNDKIFEVIEDAGEKEEYNLNQFCKDYYAGGDAPENYTPTKTEQNQIPIYSNGVENDGLYGYTNKERCTEPAITISARGTIGFVALRNEPFVPMVRLITLIPNTEIVDVKLFLTIIFFPNSCTRLFVVDAKRIDMSVCNSLSVVSIANGFILSIRASIIISILVSIIVR